MTETNVFQLAQPGTFTDSLTEVLRHGARMLLVRAVETRWRNSLASTPNSRPTMAANVWCATGHLPERDIRTGIGSVAVRQPRVRDRQPGRDGGRIRYTPTILPPYARRSKSLEVLIPILFLKGVSTGEFEEVLAALVGKDAPGLSASTIGRLKEVWAEEHAQWSQRDLSAN